MKTLFPCRRSRSGRLRVVAGAASLFAAGLFPAAVSVLTPGFALAQDISVDAQYRTTLSSFNVAGGVSHLPDGDLLAFANDFTNGPSIVRVDGNGDGVPAGGTKVLAQFDASTFADFIQVAPGGTFALAGVTGSSSTIFKVDVATEAVTPYFNAPGNYDLVFVDDGTAFLSANPGGFDPTQPNEVSLVQLTTPPTLVPVIHITNTPSGPIALNSQGDLYYIRGTFTFPAPPNSTRLLRFSAASLAHAATNGTPLDEAGAATSVVVEGGYDIAFHQLTSDFGELFFTTIGASVFRFDEKTSAVDTFLTVSDPTFPALTALSLHRPTGVFDASQPTRSELALSLTTNFFATNSLIQVRTTSFDTDGDNTPDSSDQCPRDVSKTVAGICGCNRPELDSNADVIVDCGSPRAFTRFVTPQTGAVIGGTRTITLIAERFTDSSVKYHAEIQGPDKSRRKKSKTFSGNTYTFTKLKPGVYRVKFRAQRKEGRRTRKTVYSLTTSVQVQ